MQVCSFTCTIPHVHGRAPKTFLRARNFVYEKWRPENHTSYDCNLWYICVKFHFFQNFEKGKVGPKWQKNKSVSIRILGTIPHMIVVFDTDGKMIISLAFLFLFFQNSTFSGFYMGGLCRRAKNDTQLPISVSHTLHSITAWSITVDHTIKIVGTQV